ncbi:MAG: cytochrome C oxidase subunit II [Flavobacteriaceae bacterium]|nr:cytochrome C oxidase subunit II [Flavobacteriaceae bacterium]
MITLFITLTLVFISIAIWQMIKIFDLTRALKGEKIDDSQIANDKDNRINARLMLGFLAFIYVITIICVVKYGHFPLITDAASDHGIKNDTLMIWTLALIFFVQTITQFLLHYFAYKYKGQTGNKALFYTDNHKLEIIWTIIPAIVLTGFITYGLLTWADVMNISEDDDPMVVELYAQQFNWKARYAGEDNSLGKSNVRLIDIDRANILGIDESDPNASDDIIVTELHLPVNKPVLFKMRSQDVLHSAYMPHFRAQMNCVPGMITQFLFTPNMTTEEMRNTPKMIDKVLTINEIRDEKSKELIKKGEEPLDPYDFDYLLLCNKICGKSHYNMQMKIIVESQEDFDTWISKQTVFKNSLIAQN